MGILNAMQVWIKASAKCMYVNQWSLAVIEAERYSIFILMMEIMCMKWQLLIPFKIFKLWPDQIGFHSLNP